MTDDASTKAAEDSPHYAGWPVVVASFFGVMVSFASVVPYIHQSLSVASARSIRLAARGNLTGVRHHGDDYCSLLSGIGHLLLTAIHHAGSSFQRSFFGWSSILAFLGSHIACPTLSYLCSGWWAMLSRNSRIRVQFLHGL